METINKAHPYLERSLFFSYLFCFINLVLFMINRQDFYLYGLICLLLMNYFMFYYLQRRQKKQLQYLICNADAIIDQKPFHIIDGEGEISILSHKLFILNKRYHTSLEQLKEEHIKLKDYIENISHQLKTPLTSMRINEEILLETLENDSQKELVNLIYQQTLKMNQLVHELLTLALLDSHSVELKFDHYSFEYIINDIEEDLDYLLVQNHMNIILHHHQEEILCDKKWLEEALKNIIKNYIEKNHYSTIDISIEQLESCYSIQIQDHGEGFLEEDLPHLFERFYRGKRKDYQGVGIGLALSKEIIEQHHGIIQARNHHGALIEMTLPKLLAKKKL